MRILYLSFRPKTIYKSKVLLIIILALLVLLIGYFYALNKTNEEKAISWAMAGKTIVVDAGHGGWDPGVIGSQGSLEKDINLAIAQNLCQLLSQSGALVISSRDNDMALSEEKRADLQARVDLAKDHDSSAFISIHGNSFPSQPSQHGAQVFFAANNPQSEELATFIQDQLSQPPTASQRIPLVHKSSYLLKNIPIPAIIVEVGFLSNPQENAFLLDEDYQWYLAHSIFRGIVQYFAREEDQLAWQKNALLNKDIDTICQ